MPRRRNQWLNRVLFSTSCVAGSRRPFALTNRRQFCSLVRLRDVLDNCFGRLSQPAETPRRPKNANYIINE